MTAQPPNPFDAPRAYGMPQPPLPYATPDWRPGVISWFIVYAILMAILYVVVFGLGVMILAMGPEEFADAEDSPEEVRVQAWILTAIGAPLAIVFGIAPLLPRRRWVWIYDLVLICIGMTSCCLLPATIPLLIFWIKPETRAWFALGGQPPPGAF